MTDPKNQSTLYEYTNGDLTKVTYPDQNFVTYAYSNHDLTDKYDTNIGSGYSCVQEGRTLDRILPQIKESGPRNCGEDR